MRIARIRSTEGEILYGVLEPETDYQIRVIEGDLFGHFSIGNRTAQIETLLAPVEPPNILAIGLNYRGHADEFKMNYPEHPVAFIKATTSVIGPGAPILLPQAGPERVDYECELGIIIGETCKNIAPGEAYNYILGYTCTNDVSARDWQMERQQGQWARGKSFDTFCPVGPWIVTKDEVPDPDGLRIATLLNGMVMQEGTTADMIFDVANLVSDLSRSMTLLPGTLILTGTPEGVGFKRQPPVFLKEGDMVSVSIEQIGTLTNPVMREAAIK